MNTVNILLSKGQSQSQNLSRLHSQLDACLAVLSRALKQLRRFLKIRNGAKLFFLLVFRSGIRIESQKQRLKFQLA